MHHQNNVPLEFINRFVESVTVRPFLEDLRRATEARALFQDQPIPSSGQDEVEAA